MPAYLDAAAGLPLHPVARQAYLAALDDGWADPRWLYGAGRRARTLLDAARESLAESLGARPDEVSFAPNGTTALHAAVLGSLLGAPAGRDVLVHGAVEHSAVLQAAAHHRAAGGRSLSIGVDRRARVDPEELLAAAGGSEVAAVALQATNHEVGTVQPVEEVASRIAVPLVVDVTQSAGRQAVPAGWTALAADARVWGGPTAGVLAVRSGSRWRSPGPEDERGRLPGAVDLPSAVAAAVALRSVLVDAQTEAVRQRALIERIRAEVVRRVPDTEVLGDAADRLPHIVTFSCLYADGEALVTGLDRAGFAVSSGSSCTASTLQPSHVLVAMGALTSGNVRVSLHAGVSAADVEQFLDVLPGVVADVRAALGAEDL